eukprot:Opistho-1_new@55750
MSGLAACTIRARIICRRIGAIAGGTASSSPSGSSAPPTCSPSSGSPIATRRGNSRPPFDWRTKASLTARIARLLGSSTMPCASAIGSPRCCASRPATSASAKARCAGMVNKAGWLRSPMSEHRLHDGNGLRRADIEPKALMRHAVKTARLDRAVPEDVGGKDIRRRIDQQRWRHDLHAGKDERRDMGGLAPGQPAGRVHMEIARPLVTVRPRQRH